MACKRNDMRYRSLADSFWPRDTSDCRAEAVKRVPPSRVSLDVLAGGIDTSENDSRQHTLVFVKTHENSFVKVHGTSAIHSS